MTTASEDGGAGVERKPPLTCLFCRVPKPDLQPRDIDKQKTAAGWPNDGRAYRVDDLPFFICSRCESMDTEKSRFFPAKLEEAWKEDRCVAESDQRFKPISSPCSCSACVERKRTEAEQAEELEAMHKAWAQLRFAVRTMYREGLNADGFTKRLRPGAQAPRQFNVEQLAGFVKRLCSRDPHQLYTRLEALGTQYVMEVKVNLVEILVSPASRGLPEPEPSPASEANGRLSLEQTRLFLRETLDSFSFFQETVRQMAPFMADLDEKHLEKFGITWKVVHHHLFDSIVYQNALIQAALPKMSSILKVDLTLDEGGGAGNGCRVPVEELAPAAYELAQSFRALDRLMKTSRLIWHKASQRMQDFADKQMKLYKATLKAKQRMLKEDLEFFKLQRRLLAECVAAKGSPSAASVAAASKAGSEQDLCDFTDTIRQLLTAGRRGARHQEALDEHVPCSNCAAKHCPCDECTIRSALLHNMG